ncbi:MAG: O-antigen ligase family protein [Firmicutes bacterium]|nr:O-antigen ligase family protein [Bacillota bacterium]
MKQPSEKSFTKASYICIVLVFILVPVIFSPHFAPWVKVPAWIEKTYLADNFVLIKSAVLRILVIFAVLFWIFSMIKRGAVRFAGSPFYLPIVVFALLFILSVARSISILISLSYLFDFVTFLILFFLVVQQFSKEMTRNAVVWIVAGALPVSIYGIMQHFGIDFVEWVQKALMGRRAFSTLGNPDFLGGYISTLFPLLFALLLASNKSVKSIFYLIAGFLFAITALSTYSRACWIASAAGILLLILFIGVSNLKLNWRRIALFFTIILAAFFIFNMEERAFARKSTESQSILLNNQYVNREEIAAARELSVSGRLKDIFSTTEINNAARLYLWGSALKAMGDYPYSGSGPGTFDYVFPKYRYNEPMFLRGKFKVPGHPHNEFLDVGVSTGIPGLIAFLWVVGSVFVRGVKSSKVSLNGERIIFAGLIASFAAFLINHFFVSPTTPTYAVMWFLIGAISIYSASPVYEERQPEESSKSAIIKNVLAVVSILSALLFIWFQVTEVIADSHMDRALFYKDQKMWRESLEEFESALKLSHDNVKYIGEKGNMLDAAARSLLPPRKEVFDEALRTHLRAAQLNPADSYTWERIAVLYAEKSGIFGTGQWKEAVDCHKEALRLNPYSPLFHYEYALTLQSSGDKKKAEEEFIKSISLYPYETRTYTALGMLYLESKRYTDALKQFRKAIELVPENYVAKQKMKETEEKLK